MSVRVEFYGIARQRAGRAATEIEASNLATAVNELTHQFPQLAESVFENGRIKAGFLANINGVSFTTDPATKLNSGDCLLILSADVGG